MSSSSRSASDPPGGHRSPGPQAAAVATVAFAAGTAQDAPTAGLPAAHALGVGTAVEALAADTARGLSKEEAERRSHPGGARCFGLGDQRAEGRSHIAGVEEEYPAGSHG